MSKKDYLLFRLVPTMRCNYRCSYCFLPGQEKDTTTTMFDLHSPEEWVRAMANFSDYEVEFYCWGGEPFLLDGTYDLVRGWTAYDHVRSGSRLDTNMAFADKIARLCPTDKVKLNCSWHTQYHTLDQIYAKVRTLNDVGMVGMLNFVASRGNLEILRDRYGMGLDDLIAKFDDIGVFVNIAADFSLVNGPQPTADDGYKQMILQYVTPDDWKQLRDEKSAVHCRANRHFFTIQPNGDLTPCLSGTVCGNFFDGTLSQPPTGICHNECPSIVAYPFRDDNDFVFTSHLTEYVERNRAYRKGPGRRSGGSPRAAAADAPAPRVSVVLPTYNDLAHLPQAVESVLAQTLTDFELIVVNDGSTDGTAGYLDTLADPRVRVIHQDNGRLPAALNTGFTAARGELLTWVSSDNHCAPEFLESLTGALDAHPDAGFACSAFAWIDEEGTVTGIHTDPDLSYHTLLQHNPGIASFMYRRACQDAVGLYDTGLEGVEDWDMWLRIRERFEVVFVPEVLYSYRVHEKSMTATKQEQIESAGRRVFARAIERRNGELNLLDLYPAIALCSDGEKARFEACFHFGSNFLMSPFCHLEAACRFLEIALAMSGNSPLVAGNLAVAYARADEWEKAMQMLKLVGSDPSPYLQETATAVRAAYCRNETDSLTSLDLIGLDRTESELLKREHEQRRIFPCAPPLRKECTA